MGDQRNVGGGDVDDWDAPPVFKPDDASADVTADEPGVNPAEQEALARDLGEELTDVFARYVRGEVEFADLTFLTYDVLHDLHIVASGAYELEYDEDDEEPDGDLDDTYEESEGTDQQEELAQEPARP